MEIPPASPEKKKEIKQQQKSNNKSIKNENKYKHLKTKKIKKNTEVYKYGHINRKCMRKTLKK